MNIEQIIKKKTIDAIQTLYGNTIDEKLLSIQNTRKDFIGDLTLVVFPLLRFSKKSPEITANEIGNFLAENSEYIQNYSVLKGFLNLTITKSYWISVLNTCLLDKNFGKKEADNNAEKYVIEYSSPNTNKPLHLGHIRNNLLGFSVSKILKANGKQVAMVNLVNDRGIHICKSMLAWKRWGSHETPESSEIKGDHLVGKYYVIFDQKYKAQVNNLIATGLSQKEAEKQAPLIIEAREMLRKWEAKDPDTIQIWEMMNSWVYKGFDETYKKLGVSFDKIYYESSTYKLGKSEVIAGVTKGVLEEKEDNSVWADLTQNGLDEKLLLRSDGTSVYMTQDIGTAIQRHNEFQFDKHLYVVGNEQEYHFIVLSLILKKLGYSWAKNLYHLSYGMVDLPSGKMKSREGTVVDADDLIEEMINTARSTSEELGKLEGYSSQEAENVFRTIALGALKYFILKVDPKKNMLFNPEESIDFNGNTGPFIQYSYVRIQSILRKATNAGISINNYKIPDDISINTKEVQLMKLLSSFPKTVCEAGVQFSPALIANYAYEIAREYNQFYHEYQILTETNEALRKFRLILSFSVAKVIKQAMKLLGIDVPERM